MPSGDELRALMRRYPAGVTVVTSDLDGQPLGLTVSSLVSLSLDPPLVGISISRQSPLHEAVRRSGTFGVSMLAGRQDAVAQHFARGGVPPLAMWIGISARTGSLGVPLIEGAVGWIECRLWAEYDASTHTFFVGQVAQLEDGSDDRPLVYFEHAYVSV